MEEIIFYQFLIPAPCHYLIPGFVTIKAGFTKATRSVSTGWWTTALFSFFYHQGFFA